MSFSTTGRIAASLALCASLALRAAAADLADARKSFNTGNYTQCIDACDKAITADEATAPWWALKARAQLITGRYADALKTTQSAIDRYNDDLSLWLLRYQALQAAGQTDDAKALLAKVLEMTNQSPWRYQDTPSRVALGQLMLQHGADARQVLETYFDRARKDTPDSLDAVLAIGALALEKDDYGVAADAYQSAIKIAPDDPDGYLGLARASDDDPDTANAALKKALELNPHHIESLLMVADNLIDREQYAPAGQTLDKVLDVNPQEPRAWAYRAVIAHLQGDHKAESQDRDRALAVWKTNPEVDSLIGRKLSQNYRFEVGASYQKKALAFDADYEPAQYQLCQDLLRTGQEDAGWKLAETVSKEDPYNVMAYNLVTLRDHLAKFKTLSNEHFVVRMDAREAPIYGQRVLDLLTREREQLSAKYGVELPQVTTVEIFPLQQDFEIRTFGFPGEEGFLGVCFGPVVTVNSPASRIAHPTSWEAIVWHEFCHTITLTKTHNKMPRWISEGISVYEERQADSRWGDHMLPDYREMILKDGATPVSKLTSAFMQPPSPLHLQFAYYEASMVVEYIVNRFGNDALLGVLSDLGNDVQINDALAKHTETIDKLDQDFAAFLKQQAGQLAPKADWEDPKVPPDADSAAFAAWNKEHPNSLPGLLGEGMTLLGEQKWEAAKAPLEKAIALYPNDGEADSPYLMLAKACRELKEAGPEREALEKFMALNADAVDPRVVLMDLASTQKDWKEVQLRAREVLAVNPLIPAPYRYLAESDEALGDRKGAIAARRTLLTMDPLDKPEQHYRLARLLFAEDQLPEARHEVVLSLEDAPRYRAAHGLLLEIATKMEKTPATTEVAPATMPTTEPASREPQP